jgi:hypothetical protein
MDSHGWAGGEAGREEHGQASPRGVPLIDVRVAGQMGERPSIKTDQRVGSGTMGMEAACVVGWARR